MIRVSGVVTVTTDGNRVENMDIHGILIVAAHNVTIRNCRLNSSGDTSWQR